MNRCTKYYLLMLILLLLITAVAGCMSSTGTDFTDALPSETVKLNAPKGDYEDVVWLLPSVVAVVYASEYEIDLWEYDVGIYDFAEEVWQNVEVSSLDECISSWNLVLERLPDGVLGLVNNCNIEVGRVLNRYSRLLAWYQESGDLKVLKQLPVGKDVVSFAFLPTSAAFLVTYDSSGGILGELVQIDEGKDARQLLPNYMRARDGQYSPDEESIALMASESIPDPETGMFNERIALQAKLSHPWNLYLTDTQGEELKLLLPDVRSPQYLKWSPNGQHIAFSATISNQPGIWVFAISTQKLYRVWEQRTHFDWSPDGTQMVVVDAPPQNTGPDFVPEQLLIVDVQLNSE